jgi:phage-related tail fiber protein
MTTPASQVQLTIVEDVLGELILLDAPAAQVVIGTALSSATPQPLGTATAGTSLDGARANHVHAHGDLTGATLHALATTGGAGFMSSAQFDLLNGATDQNTVSTVVRRDASGSFEASIVTADLAGNAATATALETPRMINGEPFDGTGDITITTTPTPGSIVNTSIASDADIALSKLATGALPTGITVSSDNISNGTIIDADVSANAAIAHSKLAALIAGQVLIGDVANVPTATALSGDVTVANNGVVTLANSGASPDTYTKVTVDAKGRVTAGTTLSASDVPTITAAKVSDFDGQVRLNRLDQLAAPTTSVSLNSNKITNLLDPTNPGDAANKNYVDASQQGLVVKDSVLAATTGNITLSDTQTIDGVALLTGNRVLVKNQDTGSQNGIYVVASGAWSRSADADESSEVTSGLFAFVEDGTVNGNTGWVLQTTGTITLGTTSLTFAKFSGAGEIVGGAGLIKTGGTLDINTASSSRIVVNADSIDLATAGTAGTYKSVTTDAYGRVTAGTNPTTLSGYGITDAATSTHVHGNITNDGKIGSVANVPIITTTGGVLASGSFGTASNTFCQGNDARLSDQRVPTDGSVTNAKVASNASIAYTKLDAITAGQVLLGNASNVATPTAISGDITVSSSGVTAIGAGVIVNADVSTGAAIAHSKLANITAGQVMLGNASNVPTATALSGDVTVNSSGVTAIGSGVIVDADISASAEIAVSKLADGAARQLLQTDAAGTGVEWTSDVAIPGTLAVTGATTLDNTLTIPDKIIHAGDTNTAIRFPANDTIAFETNGLESARIDSFGRFLVGTTSALNVGGAAGFESLQVTGIGMSLSNFAASGNGSILTLSRSLSEVIGTNSAVASGTVLGLIDFTGANGSSYSTAARITAAVDGTPGANDMPGRLVFSVTADGAASPTEALRINNQREVLIGTGTSTANGGVLQLAGGITFPATDVAASNGNTLDDYEEGTFTPIIEGTTTAGTGTYSVQDGRYLKIGKRVSFFVSLNWSAHTGTGNIRVSGLPFTSANIRQPPLYVSCSNLTFSDQIAANMNNNVATFDLVQISSNTGVAGVAMDTAAIIEVAGFYDV